MKTRLIHFIVFFLSATALIGQNITVKGTVQAAAADEPLVGASVVVKGTGNGAATDIDGQYSINVSPNATLVFSYVGYKRKEVKVDGNTKINVTLEEDAFLLDEAVAIGYATVRKSDLTGAVASANLKDFEKSPNSNIMQTLQGTVPGLNVGQTTTAGGTPTFSIRGKNTISGSTDVLIVLDGIIFNGNMSAINPADIERVDVLKDASATAVYGAQAANGVILITTKKGQSGKAKITFSTAYSIQNPTQNARPLNRSQWIDWGTNAYWHEAYTEESGYTKLDPNFSLASKMPAAFMTDSNGNIVDTDYDWWSEFTRTGHIWDTNFSISGGGDNVSYMISYNHTDQSNTMLNDDFKRNSVRVNLDAKARSWWKLGVSTFGSFMNNDGQETYLPFLIQMIPVATPYDSNGNLVTNPMENARENPFYGSNVDDYDRTNTFFGNFYSEFYLPLKGLTYRINFGNNYRVTDHNQANPYGQNNTGTAYKAHTTYYDYTFDNIVNYNNDFDKHSVGATFVYGAVRRKNMYTYAYSENFARFTLGYNSLGSGTTQSVSSSAWMETMLYQMLRANYSYDGRYMATATVRRDGFSGFAANNKTAVFPSVALAWVLSKEKFFKVDWVDLLKLRVGWGISGNQTSRYASLAQVTSAIGYVFGDGATGSLRQELTSLENADLKWEKTKGFNFGLDFTIFNNILSGSIEAYTTTTNDLLYNVTIPSITGYTSIASNVGKLANKGIELTLTSHNITNRDFSWTTTFNISHNSNKIKALTGMDTDGDGKEDDLSASSLFIGQSLSAIYDYKVDGIYQIGDDIPDGFYPGNYRVVDVNGDGVIDTNDRTIIGNTDPLVRMGLLNTFNYKNFHLSFFINSVLGGKNGYLGQNSNYVRQGDNALRNNVIDKEADLYWSPSNPNGIYDRAYADSKLPSAHRYEKRDFARLQDVTLLKAFQCM
jgi:TonB-linked SusC/RagA family outer membrane protein